MGRKHKHHVSSADEAEEATDGVEQGEAKADASDVPEAPEAEEEEALTPMTAIVPETTTGIHEELEKEADRMNTHPQAGVVHRLCALLGNAKTILPEVIAAMDEPVVSRLRQLNDIL